jgi:hypothetical protein
VFIAVEAITERPEKVTFRLAGKLQRLSVSESFTQIRGAARPRWARPGHLRTEIGQRTEPARGRLRAVRIFVVVAKNRPDLFEYFASGFAGVEGVEVLLDRRFGPDDQLPIEVTASYRDRRSARDIYDELEMRGFVVVRIPA